MSIRRRFARSRRQLVALTAGALAVSGATILSTAAPVAAEPLNPCVSADNGSPRIEQVTFTPASVDVRDGPQDVTLSLRAVDTGGPGEPSGIGFVYASLYAPGHGAGSMPRLRMRHETGDVWSARFTVPRGAPPGRWTLDSTWVEDRAGNATPDDDLGHPRRGEPPLDATLEVSSDPDEVAPAVTDFDVSTRRVDTRRGAKTVRFTMQASDDLSGVEKAELAVRRGEHAQYVTLAAAADGTLTGTARIPRWVGTGRWQVGNRTWIEDAVGNRRWYSRDELGALGRTGFRVVSREDTGRPRLRSFRVKPGEVDIRRDSKAVKVVVQLTDRRSGVRTVTAGFAGRTFSLKRTRGTSRRGTWAGRTELSSCQSPPRRTAILVSVEDRAGHTREWVPNARLRVRSADHRVGHVTLEEEELGVDGPITLRFREAVNGIDSASATVRRTGSVNSGPHPGLTGTWACRTGAGGATSCETGRVRRASWTPAEPLAGDTRYRVDLNPEGLLDVTDLNGNPYRREVLFGLTG